MKLMQSSPYKGKVYFHHTPIGQVGMVENGSALTHVVFEASHVPEGAVEEKTSLLQIAAEQLDEYFAGARREFDLPLAPFGTDFQRKVWAALLEIPYGQTASYRDVAERINHGNAFRAVGQANNHNPIAVIIPCHRVIGSAGELTGYAGGLEAKEFLLKLETDVVCGRARSCPD